MKIVVEKKSPYGVQFEGKWYNKSKFDDVNLDVLVVGQEIEAVISGDKYIKSYTLTGNVMSPSKPQIAQGKDKPQAEVFSTREETARAQAVRAVLESGNLFGDAIDEAIEKYTKYILTGGL